MAPAGLAKVEFPSDEVEDPPQPASPRQEYALTDEMLQAVRDNPAAWENFNKLPPSLRNRNFVGWVMSARREETRWKRLREMIDVLAQGKRLGLK